MTEVQKLKLAVVILAKAIEEGRISGIEEDVRAIIGSIAKK